MHVSLYVSNIESTVDFYREFFQVEPSKVKEGYAKFTLDSPALIISFVEKPDRIKDNFGHLGFQVQTGEELKEAMTRLQSQGHSLREEIGTSCCYALQDKFWITDPDGYQWEVYHFHDDVEFNDPHYQIKDQPVEKQKVTLGEPASCSPDSGCC
ncbi:MAG: glyoxalase/bleomycin resistance/dioxygenase family protein [Flavobacteriales bacterium]|nr:glyoxalase/bleomycin resistance/dioxygenase family protein [Flavobacteriales bacterium]